MSPQGFPLTQNSLKTQKRRLPQGLPFDHRVHPRLLQGTFIRTVTGCDGGDNRRDSSMYVLFEWLDR